MPDQTDYVLGETEERLSMVSKLRESASLTAVLDSETAAPNQGWLS
jgi:hypothetical protein